MLPLELYREIFSHLDLLTALRFRSVCKVFAKFHTVATKQHSQIKNIHQAIAMERIELLKAMAVEQVPLFVQHLDLVVEKSAIDRDDVSFFKMLVECYHLNSQAEYILYLKTAWHHAAFNITEYIMVLGVVPESIVDEIVCVKEEIWFH